MSSGPSGCMPSCPAAPPAPTCRRPVDVPVTGCSGGDRVCLPTLSPEYLAPPHPVTCTCRSSSGSTTGSAPCRQQRGSIRNGKGCISPGGRWGRGADPKPQLPHHSKQVTLVPPGRDVMMMGESGFLVRAIHVFCGGYPMGKHSERVLLQVTQPGSG